ncbi:uncharacterized protein LOC124938542 isoform X2 [Impatiens glandulifera]|uniref:uncharacterized protein LOC124938542 isoform X2 n=1 Tax=Impatiens glandulifera TaxID=253017 RepID=UPI001FB11D93|nr:uncharacterized protein LOC124938542 isoform X2 [Impatiens glandulifera]
MASNLGSFSRFTPCSIRITPLHRRFPLTSFIKSMKSRKTVQIRASNVGDSYLHMWKNAMERERKSSEFQKIANNSVTTAGTGGGDDDGETPEVLERKSNEFQKLLEVSPEERDRIQRMQVIDRAAAAIAAARSLVRENSSKPREASVEEGEDDVVQPRGSDGESIFISESKSFEIGTPGPNFWAWTPPKDSEEDETNNTKPAEQISPKPKNVIPLLEKERSTEYLSIPLESRISEASSIPVLPPFQSLKETEKVLDVPTEERERDILFSGHAEKAAQALTEANELLCEGFNPDGSRWWKETGIEQRPDGVVCKWTLTRGVSADKTVEFEDKYWEAANEFGFKELGSEKSGRDAEGNVWHEFWKESMWQDNGLLHLEKTANKWGVNARGEEWQEKWWEHYDAAGEAEKWAHKWCSIDPTTPLDDGHAHVWHERWGEKFDGKGSSIKYTDKWAERCEGDGWSKWGDKWDENFDQNGRGVKQGETWWEGKYGERWNRTWGEGHNGSGWVHKYGKSSSGEHWDTHEQQDTWYERFPHYGFQHCFDNTVQLREVKRPSDWVEEEETIKDESTIDDENEA